MDISVRTEAWTVENRAWLGSRDGTPYTESITLDTSAFTANTHYPNGYVPSGLVLAKVGNLYVPYAGGTSEVQTVTITGSPTGGTFTLTFDGATTAAIAYNAAASAVQAALEALPNITAGDVTVTGSAGGPYTITFAGQYTGTNVGALTATGSLTGGSSPAVGIATTTGGGSAGSGGAETAAGVLFNSTEMRSGGPDVGAPLLWRGVIVVAKLPSNSGFDATARRQLANWFRFK